MNEIHPQINSSPYPPPLVRRARELHREVERAWSYYCPFCIEIVDGLACGIEACGHLIIIEVPGYHWVGPYAPQMDRLQSLVRDAAYEQIDLKALSSGLVFWENLAPQEWADLDRILIYHPQLLDVSRRNLEFDRGSEAHYLLSSDDLKRQYDSDLQLLMDRLNGCEKLYQRRIRALEGAGRSPINAVPFALQGLSPRKSRELLLQALQHSESAAMSAVYAAAMAVHGCPVGTGQAGWMSWGYLMTLRQAVTEVVGLEVLEAARHHPSEAVRKSVEQERDEWIETAKRNSWPAHLTRWPKPNPD